MAQTFHTIQGSEIMKDSRPKLNENFETLRSGFEGASEPANPVKGQRAFVGNVWKTYNGSAWVTDDALHNHDARYYTQSQADALLAGKANTSHTHDERYYTETETNSLLAGKSDTSHTHDARYYTESEIDTLLAGKSSTSHTHTYAIGNLSDVTIATPGSGQIIGHDGSGWKNRTLADAGISAVGHGHSYEAPLGNPDVDGKMLVSTAAGVRSWKFARPASPVAGNTFVIHRWRPDGEPVNSSVTAYTSAAMEGMDVLRCTCLSPGSIRISIDICMTGTSGICYARVLKNETQEVEWSQSNTSFVTKTYDMNVEEGDRLLIQIRGTIASGRWRNAKILSDVATPAII